MTPRRSFLAALAALVIAPLRLKREEPLLGQGWILGTQATSDGHSRWSLERLSDGAVWNEQSGAWENRLTSEWRDESGNARHLTARNLKSGRYLRSSARWRREARS